MKRTLSIICIITTMLSLISCTGKGGKLKLHPDKLIGWTTYSYDKLIVSTTPSVDENREQTVYMARGESEACQIALWSNVARKKIKLELVSEKNDAIAVSIYTMDKSYKIKRKYYIDPLIPYAGKRINLEANTTLPFLIDFKTTADTPVGDYKFEYVIKDSDDNVLKSFDITLHVWDIVIPEDQTFSVSMAISQSQLGRFYKGTLGTAYKQFYDLLLENRISAYDLPCSILTDEADAYMSDPRVTSFKVPHNGTDEEVTALYNKVKTDPVWLEKAFFYPMDEPSTAEALKEYAEQCERLQKLAPEIKIVVPFYKNIQTGVGADQVDAMAPCTNLWCPKLCLWDESESYKPFLNYTPDKTFDERMAEFKN